MYNPYEEYYLNQVGSGLGGFEGTRFQRGHGFFGRLFTSKILPALKFLGKHALSAGINVADDVLHGGNVKESFKTRFKETGHDVAEKAVNRARIFAQTGKGLRRRKSKRRTKAKTKKLKKKKVNKQELIQRLAKARKVKKQKQGRKKRKTKRKKVSFLD